MVACQRSWNETRRKTLVIIAMIVSAQLCHEYFYRCKAKKDTKNYFFGVENSTRIQAKNLTQKNSVLICLYFEK